MNFNNLNWQPPISYSKPNSEALKALEQESKTMTREEEQSEDCISRKALLEQMRREYGSGWQFVDIIENAPSVMPSRAEDGRKRVSEDCISKHDIWKIIEDNAYWVRYNENSSEKGMTLTGINQALNECPPVTPAERTGECCAGDCCAGCKWEYKWVKECDKCCRGYIDNYERK